MISGGGIAGVVAGIFFGCLAVIGAIALVTIKFRRSVEAVRQEAVQSALDESQEVDGFQVIAINEKNSFETGSLADTYKRSMDTDSLAATQKRSMDTGSLASSISDISALDKPEAAPKAGTTPA
ncbi:hypothetical protein IWW50_002791 [Coemansia erecta]|nr:hypothetical protein GGF43_002905 [Coemansia sp. RSA 2618]KAJ2825564.1 hypothetical protein IWW50_002791 [Coemansia erecta]